MLTNATNQPKSTVELGYMCPRGLLGPPAVTLTNKDVIFQLQNLRQYWNRDGEKSVFVPDGGV